MDEGGFEVVPQPKIKKRKALTCEELALGEQMVHSKKRKRDIMDAGWNRYMFEDTGLPDWFVKEEEMHMKRRPDVDPETVQKYRLAKIYLVCLVSIFLWTFFSGRILTDISSCIVKTFDIEEGVFFVTEILKFSTKLSLVFKQIHV